MIIVSMIVFTVYSLVALLVFFFKQKTAYEMRISDWSSDVCSSDLGVIDAGQDGPSLMLAIKQAADEGALIALLVDRTQPGAATQPAEFFGAPARFPVAPWMIAAVLKLPVSLAFGL